MANLLPAMIPNYAQAPAVYVKAHRNMGQRHLQYLKEYKQFVYLNLLTSGRLNEYLASVDEQAEDMFSRLVKEYADRQGVTEQLKAENQLEWVGKMNNIRSRAVEIIDVELICV